VNKLAMLPGEEIIVLPQEFKIDGQSEISLLACMVED
jgi:hypothetical protein